jgi:hypothetical protein
MLLISKKILFLANGFIKNCISSNDIKFLTFEAKEEKTKPPEREKLKGPI